MTSNAKRELVCRLLENHGLLFSSELGIDLNKGTPAPLFRWLCASILFSARISQKLANKTASALSDHGWRTPQRMAASTWEQRVKVLNVSGYARYDESTSRMLGESTALLINEYGGDLRKLRKAAQKQPEQERKLLKQFKGLGDVGVDIFFREAQICWEELYPFADKRAIKAANTLHLAEDASGLSKLVDATDFARLIAALVRVDIENHYAEFA